MSSQVLIKNIIELSISELNYNIHDVIKEKLKNLKCNLENGYLLEILDIKDIESLPLNRSCNPSFKITYKAITLKPYIGMELSTKIIFLNPEGIYLKYHQLDIFVPGCYMKSQNQIFLDLIDCDENVKLDELKKLFKKYSKDKTKKAACEYLIDNFENLKKSEKINYFIHKNKKYELEDEIIIKIINLQYKKNNFKCIGQFI